MTRRAIPWTTLFLLVVLAIPLIHGAVENSILGVVAADDQPQSARETTTAHKVPTEFKQAGVCARCHVISVLEWGISAHVEAEADCRKCHGPSRGHVDNERNEIKPDRLPRGEAIAKKLCADCHETGCPETLQVQTCKKCHHVHALINPSQPPTARDDRLEELLSRWQHFESRMADAEGHVKQQDFQAAQAEFREALKLIPGNHRAQLKLKMCTRRLNPQLPGFLVVGKEFDAETGLPRQVRVADLDVSMMLVAPGEFDMGSDRLTDSRPVHTVRVDAFYLGRYEVTQGQWQTIMGENPSAHQGDGFPDARRMPVERVSWNDCQEFLRRLNARIAGSQFRLPTEAEWEYACRAGGEEPQGGADSSEIVGRRAWYRANSARVANPDKLFLQIDAYSPRPVGMRQPNVWSFYDMQGNIAEWCSSLLRPYLYDTADGRESVSAKGMRVLRGGGFADGAMSLDPALRHAERPHRRLRWNGLRLARDVPSL